jgi:hypothetical protein
LLVFDFVWLWIDFDLFTAGNVVCSWGRGEDGQLGHGSTDDRLLPTQLSALDSQQIVSVVCGADHTIAYSESRVEVYSWGWYANSIFSIVSLKFTLLRKCILFCLCFLLVLLKSHLVLFVLEGVINSLV